VEAVMGVTVIVRGGKECSDRGKTLKEREKKAAELTTAAFVLLFSKRVSLKGINEMKKYKRLRRSKHFR